MAGGTTAAVGIEEPRGVHLPGQGHHLHLLQHERQGAQLVQRPLESLPPGLRVGFGPPRLGRLVPIALYG
jgi:hypothetical protein